MKLFGATGIGLAWTALLVLSLSGCGNVPMAAAKPVVRVGSKSFTENFLLGEMIAQIIEETGEADVERKMGLGGSAMAYRAVSGGDIDIYPEYTGTLSQALLEDPTADSVVAIRRRLQSTGLTISDSLGFDNTYAIAVRQEMARRLGLRKISDLKRHPELRAAFSPGYIDRADGWPGLKLRYGLEFIDVRVIEHVLSYEAMSSGEVDIIDIFSTDGKIDVFDLWILDDDLEFFPDYQAVMLVRRSFIERFPGTWQRLTQLLVDRIDDRQMVRLNAMVDLEGRSIRDVSGLFLGHEMPSNRRSVAVWQEIFQLTLEHMYLVFVSLGLAVVVGLPLGLIAARLRLLAQIGLMSVGVLQTIPALALLCFMIPLFGIGRIPSLVALFLYALLPIVRNTYTGLIGLDRQLLEIATAMGLSRWQRLLRVELPLSSLNIMAGIKTSAILTVGTAPLAAFIGGGYGSLIVRGLALNDVATILAGAVPSAVMALVIHGGFEYCDRALIPRGLRKDFSHS